MQSNGFLLIYFILSITPIFILSVNQNLFFVGAGTFLLGASILNMLYSTIRVKAGKVIDDEKVNDEEYEEMAGTDIQRFGSGIGVIKQVTIILFFIYSNFYIQAFTLKAIIALLIVHRVYNIVSYIRMRNNAEKKVKARLVNIMGFIVSAATVVIILIAGYVKFTLLV